MTYPFTGVVSRHTPDYNIYNHQDNTMQVEQPQLLKKRNYHMEEFAHNICWIILKF
jgi:hypothetical protein